MKIAAILSLSFLALVACGEAEEEPSKETEVLSEPLDTIIELNSEDFVLADSSYLPQRVQEEPEMIIGSADGDLDKDGVVEKVVVFSRDLEWESSAPRDLIIYKKDKSGWSEWWNSDNVIGRADEGGMMGDPFDGVAIKSGVLEINHSGGSSWKWSNVDKYRYQDEDFFLIGHTSTYGKPCEYWQDVDYNLSTGDCSFSFTVDNVEGCGDYDARGRYGADRREDFKHKMESLPKLENHREFTYEFETPKGEKIYL